MRMDLGTRNTLLYDFMHCMTAVSLEMSDEPKNRGISVSTPPPLTSLLSVTVGSERGLGCEGCLGNLGIHSPPSGGGARGRGWFVVVEFGFLFTNSSTYPAL